MCMYVYMYIHEDSVLYIYALSSKSKLTVCYITYTDQCNCYNLRTFGVNYIYILYNNYNIIYVITIQVLKQFMHVTYTVNSCKRESDKTSNLPHAISHGQYQYNVQVPINIQLIHHILIIENELQWINKNSLYVHY